LNNWGRFLTTMLAKSQCNGSNPYRMPM
jgi:hypothetical protein